MRRPVPWRTVSWRTVVAVLIGVFVFSTLLAAPASAAGGIPPGLAVPGGQASGGATPASGAQPTAGAAADDPDSATDETGAIDPDLEPDTGIGSDTPENNKNDGLTGNLVGQALSGFSQWALRGVGTVVMALFSTITTKSTPVVNANRTSQDWFAIQYQMMMNVGWWLMLPLLFMCIIHSIIKGSIQLLMRSMVLYLPLAILGTVVATQVVQLLISIVDDMCLVFVGMIREDLNAFFAGLNNVFFMKYSAMSALLGLVLAAVLLVISAFLLIMFLLRDSSVYMAVMFLPIGFAMMVWPMAARYFRKMVEFLVGIILSKLVMVVIISLSVAALAGSTGAKTAGQNELFPNGAMTAAPGASVGNANGGDGLDEGFLQRIGYIFPALVMLLLAAVSPPMTVRLVGNMGLQEMAGQVASSVENQAWLYQYIGMDRMTKVWVTNNKKLASQIKNYGKATIANRKGPNNSEADKMLSSKGFSRNKDGPNRGTFIETYESLDKQGIRIGDVAAGDYTEADVKKVIELCASSDPNKISLGKEAIRQMREGEFHSFGEDTQIGGVIYRKGPPDPENDGHYLKGEAVIDFNNPNPGGKISKNSLRRLDAIVRNEADRQEAAFGRVQGIQISSGVQMTFNERGRVAPANRYHKANKEALDAIARGVNADRGTDNVRAVHARLNTARDFAARDVDDRAPAGV